MSNKPWTVEVWLNFFHALDNIKTKLPNSSVRDAMIAAMCQLDACYRRPVHTNGVGSWVARYNHWKRTGSVGMSYKGAGKLVKKRASIHEAAVKSDTDFSTADALASLLHRSTMGELAEKLDVTNQAILKKIEEIKANESAPIQVVKPTRAYLTETQVQELLRVQRDQLQASISQIDDRFQNAIRNLEANVIAANSKMYESLTEMLLSGNRPASSEAPSTTAPAPLSKHDPSPIPCANTDKRKKVMVFGALPAQVRKYQEELGPTVIVKGTDKLTQAIGLYDIVIVLKDFIGHSDTSGLEKFYGKRVHVVSGAITRGVECIKNHLMLP